MSADPLLLTIGAAAEALSCSTRLVEKLIASGELRSLRLGKRARRVPVTSLRDYIDSRLGEAQP
jgi:excisionase family DNA binding protein